jgi:hypothetical protein
MQQQSKDRGADQDSRGQRRVRHRGQRRREQSLDAFDHRLQHAAR